MIGNKVSAIFVDIANINKLINFLTIRYLHDKNQISKVSKKRYSFYDFKNNTNYLIFCTDDKNEFLSDMLVGRRFDNCYIHTDSYLGNGLKEQILSRMRNNKVKYFEDIS